MNKEQEKIVGEHIRKLAVAICEALKCQWSNIVFTVAYRKGEKVSRLTDMFYFRFSQEDDYINAYSEEGISSLNMSALRKIADAYRKLSEVCEVNGSRWSQYTICIDNMGHFESFFDYPHQINANDPFDRANIERWELRFLYSD